MSMPTKEALQHHNVKYTFHWENFLDNSDIWLAFDCNFQKKEKFCNKISKSEKSDEKSASDDLVELQNKISN